MSTEEVMKGLVKVYGTENLRQPRENTCLAAVKCFRDDLDDLLTFPGFTDTSFRRKKGTTNAMEPIFMVHFFYHGPHGPRSLLINIIMS